MDLIKNIKNDLMKNNIRNNSNSFIHFNNLISIFTYHLFY